MKSLLNNNTVVIKSAVAFFFLFFLNGFSIGNGQKGISYNVWHLRMFTRKAGITPPLLFSLLNLVYALRHPSREVASRLRVLRVFPYPLE